MCFSRQAPPRVASVRRACLSDGMMFTIMGRGSPISASHAATPLCAAPALRLKRDEIENNATFMYRVHVCVRSVPQERWSDSPVLRRIAFQNQEIWRSVGCGSSSAEKRKGSWFKFWLRTNVGNGAGSMRGDMDTFRALARYSFFE